MFHYVFHYGSNLSNLNEILAFDFCYIWRLGDASVFNISAMTYESSSFYLVEADSGELEL